MMRRLSSSTAARYGACALTLSSGRSVLKTPKRFATAATEVRVPHEFEQFSYAGNTEYVDNLLELYLKDKSLVDKSWHPILENVSSASPDEALVAEFSRPSTFFKRDSAATAKECADNMKLAWMVRAYEMKGHLICDLDPLGMFVIDHDGTTPSELDPAQFGFTTADQEQEFKVRIGANFGGLVTQGNTPMKLREIIALLKTTYCSRVGFEFMHAGFSDTRVWFRDQIMKTIGAPPAEERRNTLRSIIRAERFEKFLHKKYQTHKRFGLDGGESLIAAMKAVINQGANHGVENFVVGMPHRGRLNVLVNVCEKDLHRVFNEFAGRCDETDCPGTASGDVKYHLGLTKKVVTLGGKTVEMSLLANPSHLECINPLVLGRARAKQLYGKDEEMTKTVPILMHGDAAFSGQGVCYESMGLTSLENYHVGGCLHIVVNNQIGFTTNPQDSRSATYCTDLAKVVDAPVFHVNGDDPDQVVRVSKMAMDYRQQFKKDVIIDLVCYRRYGHNETDQPMFTQPLMYTRIDKQPTILKLYGDKCVADGVMTRDELDKEIAQFDSLMHDQFIKAEKGETGFKPKDWDESPSDTYANSVELSALRDTGANVSNLQEIGNTLTTIPKDFVAHKTVKNVYAKRVIALKDGKNIDWGLAEQLAFGTLSLEGVHIRLTGQDVERGTFAQRHCKFHNVETGASYLPLGNLHKTQAPITVQNSSLSEFGVCGFETGYSMENPKSLVMWEAQFGDFSNGAQVIFDQFLASGEAKWIRQCSLVVSLPHGYDGQGPEHSSGRIERYLQLSDSPDAFPADFNPAEWQHVCEKRIKEQNWQVCYPTTAANYFHLLRRQVHREFRKPLINFFSKNLLRNETALSTLDDMKKGTTVSCVLDHHRVLEQPRKLVFCSGQVYSKLLAAQEADTAHRGNVALIRLEQLAPFCWEPIYEVINAYRTKCGHDVPIVWAQEEPKNMGPWSFVRVRMNNLLKHLNYETRIHYTGRPAAASPAPGHGFQYVAEEAEIVRQAFE